MTQPTWWVLAALLAAPRVAAQEVVAVLASDLGPYRAALAGLEGALGHSLLVRAAGDASSLPASARVVVAIGSQAAVRRYPDGIALVYCMAPGIRAEDLAHTGPKVAIHMSPPADVVVGRFRELQPRLGRLVVFWSSESIRDYIAASRSKVRASGVALIEERLESPHELPERLRRLGRGIDAIWLPPDPPLVNEATFAVLKSFSIANKVPFYAPTEGLVTKGAVASVSASFTDIGRAAALAARHLLERNAIAVDSYPARGQVTFNVQAARQSGLHVPADVLKKLDRVLQ